MELCKACEYCCGVCPKKMIYLSNETNSRGYHYAEVRDMANCTGCRFCAIMCPEVAIEITTGNQTTGGDLKSG
ncbi:MAG: 4Fe-4S dicluster domain-containing protein [Candidatus Bathyarchaeia archaeon]